MEALPSSSHLNYTQHPELRQVALGKGALNTNLASCTEYQWQWARDQIQQFPFNEIAAEFFRTVDMITIPPQLTRPPIVEQELVGATQSLSSASRLLKACQQESRS